jgi:predicted nucleic acid-binding protein
VRQWRFLHPQIALFSPAAEQGRVAVGRVRTRTYAAKRQADSFAAMPKPRVYVETTIPNFYYDFRDSPAVVQRREITRTWWVDAINRYELITSSTVRNELAAGTSDRVPLRLALLRGLPLLFPSPEIDDITAVYVSHRLMPSRPSTADAIHLALASFHHCDFIVTWDSRHLANPNKAVHIRRINTALNLHVPELVTPQDLLARMP